MQDQQPATPLRALILDWGGVLTADLDASMSAWARRDGVRYEDFVAALDLWLGPDVHESPVHRLELGLMTPEDFEDVLADELARHGSAVPPRGLLRRMLADLVDLDPRMLGAVRAARAAGVRTALLSNSWGEHYPDEIFDDLFDAVVISGRVGMRKPQREIFEHTATTLGVPPSACVMVDDLPANVAAAVSAGMVGVRHVDVATTLTELDSLFGPWPTAAPRP